MTNNKNNGKGEIEEFEVDYSEISDIEIDDILSKEKKINEKSSRLELNRFSRFIKQMRLAMSLVKDFRNKAYTDVPWRSIALIAAAVLYFINPFDAVPDMLPVFGIADDAMLFAAVFKSIQSDLVKYGEWKGINTKGYF